MPPPCTCPYFGDTKHHGTLRPAEVKIITTSRSFRSTSSSLHDTTVHSSISDSPSMSITTATTSSPSKSSLQLLPVPPTPPIRKHSYSKSNSVVTWDTKRNQRRGSSFGGVKTSLQVNTKKKLQNFIFNIRLIMSIVSFAFVVINFKLVKALMYPEFALLCFNIFEIPFHPPERDCIIILKLETKIWCKMKINFVNENSYNSLKFTDVLYNIIVIVCTHVSSI